LSGIPTLAVPAIFRNAAFTFNSYAAIIENMSVDFGQVVGKQMSANAATGVARYRVQDYQPKVEFDPEVVALSTFNPYTLWSGATLAALAASFISSAGSVALAISNLQLDPPKVGARETAQIYQLSATPHASTIAANFAVTLTFA
jgi:hypothetical protein